MHSLSGCVSAPHSSPPSPCLPTSPQACTCCCSQATCRVNLLVYGYSFVSDIHKKFCVTQKLCLSSLSMHFFSLSTNTNTGLRMLGQWADCRRRVHSSVNTKSTWVAWHEGCWRPQRPVPFHHCLVSCNYSCHVCFAHTHLSGHSCCVDAALPQQTR